MKINIYIFILLFLFSGKLIAQNTSKDSLRKMELWYDDEYQVRKLKSVYYVLEDDPTMMHGKMVSYYENGKVVSEGYYHMNQPIGKWIYYFEDGRVKMVGDLKTATDGYWKYFFENGKLKQEGEITNNKQEGIWKFYFEEGAIKNEGSYVHGIKDGVWKYFFENGNIKAEAVYENGQGSYKEFYLTGEAKMEGNTINNLSEGEWRYYYPSGQLKAMGYELHGVKNGHWEYYYENGIKSSEGNYVDGKQHDKWTYYYEDGVVSSEGEHYEGDKDGQWKLFHKNGAFKGEGMFRKGDGDYKEYYESGVLKIQGTVAENKNEGVWKYYYEDGTLEGEANFSKGKAVYTGYHKDGTKKMEGVIEDNQKIGVWELYNEDGSLAGYYKTIYDEKGEEVFQKEKESISVVDSVIPIDSTKHYDYTHLPKYKYKPKKKSRIRNFNSKVNEYTGIIVSSNPLGFVNTVLPVYVEYYTQERLGYELQYSIHRNPFFMSDDKIPANAVYNRGQSVDFAQRFYKVARSYGMVYFGHRIRLKNNVFSALVRDTADFVPSEEKIEARDNSIEYLWMFGDRVFGNYHRGGFTFDIFLTMGAGYRWFKKKYVETPFRERLFSRVPQSSFYIPIRLEFSFGYSF